VTCAWSRSPPAGVLACSLHPCHLLPFDSALGPRYALSSQYYSYNPGTQVRYRQRGSCQPDGAYGRVNRLRILMLCAAFDGAGGVATHAHSLVYGLAAQPETRVDLVTRADSKDPQDHIFRRKPKGSLIQWTYRVESVPDFDDRRVLLSQLFECIAKRWDVLQPEIIHAHDFDSLHLGWLLKNAFGVPLVMTMHRAPTPWRPNRHRENSKDALMETARRSRAIDWLFVPSAASADVLYDQGFRRVEVVPHAMTKKLVDHATDPNLLTALGIPIDRPIVLCPVRGEEHKDPHVFIRGAALAKKEMDANCVFVMTCDWSDGAQRDPFVRELPMIARAHKLKPGKDLVITRRLEYGQELATMYRAAKVFVVPSLHESFGQVVLDAFLFNKPVIARNSMALPEIIDHDRNGLLFTTAQELSWQLTRLLAPQNEKVVEKLVQAAAKDLESRFDIPRMTGTYLSRYMKIIADHRAEQERRKKGRQRRPP
jgi:glycosyltransferase involved in cell wall biosynthesis